jgi:predicted amidophosphoribosyltransferase
MVGMRPRTQFKLDTKQRVCPKCGAKVNNQRVRCKKCSEQLGRPIKRKTKAKKARVKTRAKRRLQAAGKKV